MPSTCCFSDKLWWYIPLYMCNVYCRMYMCMLRGYSTLLWEMYCSAGKWHLYKMRMKLSLLYAILFGRRRWKCLVKWAAGESKTSRESTEEKKKNMEKLWRNSVKMFYQGSLHEKYMAANSSPVHISLVIGLRKLSLFYSIRVFVVFLSFEHRGNTLHSFNSNCKEMAALNC